MVLIKKWHRILPICFPVIAAIIYANTLNNPFIFDDISALVNNEKVREAWPIWNMFVWNKESAVAGRPVVNFSFMLNYAWGEYQVTSYRVVNIIIHMLAALAFLGVIRQTLLLRQEKNSTASALAFFAAVIWMVHPMQTECINYTVQRTESMMGLFFWLTLYCGIRSAWQTRRAKWWQWTAVLACFLGILSKETMVTAPVIVALFDYVFLPGTARETWKKRRSFYLLLASSWLLLVVLMWDRPRTGTVGFHHQDQGSWNYLLNQADIIVDYIWRSLWPYPLLMDYGYPESLTLEQVWPEALLLTGLFLASAVAVIKRSQLGFLGAWFFIILSPSSSFVPIITEVGAERRMYLPLAALVVLVVIGGYFLARWLAPKTGNWLPRLSWGVWALVALVLMGMTIKRNYDYRSNEAIWKTVVQAHPSNHRALNNLGVSLIEKGKQREAIPYLRKGLEIKPDSTGMRENLAQALEDIGKMQESLEQFEKAVELNPHIKQLHKSLGDAYYRREMYQHAIECYQQALEIDPEYALAEHSIYVTYKKISEQKKQ